MPRPRPLVPITAAALAAAAVLAGCANAVKGDDPVKLTVSSDFGARVVLEKSADAVPASETAMRLIQRNADVSTRYGGGFVQCVNDLCGGETSGRREDWFYFVNGIEAPKGAAATRVRPGDHIWWDRRAWDAAERVPAVVGSFPEPFLHGPGDKRLPVRVECLRPQDDVCRDARQALVDFGISASKTTLRSSIAQETLRVVVGTWNVLREDGALRALEDGPAASGVYAEPRADGRSIALLDPRGRIVRTLRAGGGLVAATRVGEEQPVWALTGTDAAGVAAAVGAFTERTLRNRFAVAVEGGAAVALPVQEGSR